MYQARTTAHLKAHFPPPLSPLILLRGDDGWMFQTMWICNWVCLCNQPRQFCVCGIFMFFPLLSCWIPTYPHLFKANAMFLQWTSPSSCGRTASNSNKCWVNMHTAPLLSERQKWVWFSALENSVDCPLLSSCAYCTVKYIIIIICYTLGLYTTGPKRDW